MRRCPRCLETLKTDSVEGVLVDGCPACAGIWFDEKELTQVAHSHKGALVELEDHFVPDRGHKQATSVRGGLCPNCGNPLFTFELKHSKGILLDGCRTCKGVWVDEGELRAIWQKIQTDAPHKRADGEPAPRSRLAAVASFLTKVSCPICNESNPASALVCWRCQAVLHGRWGAMLCPDCNGRLVVQDWGELALDRCQSCSGLWMDDQSLAKLLQEGPPSPEVVPPASSVEGSRFALLETSPAGPPLPPPTSPPDHRLCPTCHRPLFRYEYAYSSGIHLDKCRSCEGVWMDGGELEALSRFLAQSRA